MDGALQQRFCHHLVDDQRPVRAMNISWHTDMGLVSSVGRFRTSGSRLNHLAAIIRRLSETYCMSRCVIFLRLVNGGAHFQ